MKSITPFLWFDGVAEDAMNLYLSLFPDAKALGVSRAGPDGPVISVQFELLGQRFIGLNGGPGYQFTPAVSFLVLCDSQDEIDRLWTALTEGGAPDRCGWLKDRFGVSWQIVPSGLSARCSATPTEPKPTGRCRRCLA
ncbi:MAG: VOC family protein [Gemmatimonadales bacterium]